MIIRWHSRVIFIALFPSLILPRIFGHLKTILALHSRVNIAANIFIFLIEVEMKICLTIAICRTGSKFNTASLVLNHFLNTRLGVREVRLSHFLSLFFRNVFWLIYCNPACLYISWCPFVFIDVVLDASLWQTLSRILRGKSLNS